MTGIAHAKNAVLEALRLHGIATVEIAYDGEGDNGQIEQILAYDADRKPLPLSAPDSLHPDALAIDHASLGQALDDFAWMVLAHFHEGFEINDGGFGRITVDVAKGSVIIDHNDRVIESVNTETEL